MEKEEGRERIGAVSVNGELEGKLGGEVEKEDEEERIDKFYALIRNFREERNRLRNELIISNNHDQLEMIRKKNKRKYCNESSSWTPTFELEDFKQDYFIKKPLQIFPPPPPPRKKQEEDRDENGLDLKLTL